MAFSKQRGISCLSGAVLVVLLGAGTRELWMRVAQRDRPWQLESYVDILAANCRTVPGSFVFSAELGALAAQVNDAKSCLSSANGTWAITRDYAPCVDKLLGASLTALRIRTKEAIRLQEEKARLGILLGTLGTELGIDPQAGKTEASFEIKNYDQSRARMLVEEARNLAALGQMESALIAVLRASMAWAQSQDFVAAELARFYDPELRAQWEKQAQDLLRWTKQTGRSAILVDKLEHRCLLLADGHVESSYAANLGRNWYRTKVREHDASTPEGEYRIKGKFRSGSFGWAVLLDYPNAADRQRFNSMKKSGEIAVRVGIGGNIEIHGGGRLNSDWTDGCVSLKNADMAELYKHAYIGMPVTIVGTSRLAAALKE
jgi:L,D-peptidoglycan transpeptidase YkuD (ErfK/YbiS/YcfS/YnhG family)